MERSRTSPCLLYYAPWFGSRRFVVCALDYTSAHCECSQPSEGAFAALLMRPLASHSRGQGEML